jgi:cytochrome P450
MAQVEETRHPDDGPEVRVGPTVSAEYHNLAAGAGVIYDVYPVYHDLIERCPIHEGSVRQYFDNPSGWQGETFFPEGDVFTANSYRLVQEGFRKTSVFSSQFSDDPTLNARVGLSILSMDEPEHKRLRMLLQPAFAKPRMEAWKRDIIQPIVDFYIERIRPRGSADLYFEVAPNVPIQTASVAMGLPAEDQRKFFDLACRMTSGDERMEAAMEVGEYIAPLIVERRANPSDDLLSLLTQARIEAEDAEGIEDTRPLDDEEIAAFVRLLIIAGAGTTYKAYGNLMFQLLTHPDQLDAVREDRSLVPLAIEESLRIETPVAAMARRASQATELGGCPIPKGFTLTLNMGAANHDPAQWGDDADSFDIHRESPDRHFTFGFGIHRCLGIHLARAELEVLCNRTLDLLPNVRLDPAQPAPRTTGLGMRMPTALPVVWDV